MTGPILPWELNERTLGALIQTGAVSEEGDQRIKQENEGTLRIIPAKNTILFPHNVLPFISTKHWASDAIEEAAKINQNVGIIAQKDPSKTNPNAADLFEVGTECRIIKIIRLPDDSHGAVVQGIRRFRVIRYLEDRENSLIAQVRYFTEETASLDMELVAIGKVLKQLVQKAISLSPNIPGEAGFFIENVSSPSYLADMICPYLTLDTHTKQSLLEMESIGERLRKVHYYLAREIEILEVSQRIHSEVKSEIGKHQRRYYVREQLKLLHKELGEMDGTRGSSSNEPEDLAERIENSKMPAEAKQAAQREAERLSSMAAGSPEHVVSTTYINWLLDIPWSVVSEDNTDLKRARAILDEDHYGLDRVKKRIIEFLAVYALKKSLKGPILLLVGPPGVGKTSLGRSVAKALGRKFVRIALGGVRDEAEIRGHRRTYIGSMPGKIADALKRAGTMNPIIMFDEVDKISADHRGDPANALLEVLDSEQNHAFMDHYLNVPLDLSKVMFLATANSLQTVSDPLRDRMEIIELSGYTLNEKVHIAYEHLLPQVLDEHGLKKFVDLRIPEKVMHDLLQTYTREAGVRQAKRELAGVARNVAKELVDQGLNSENTPKRPKRKSISGKEVHSWLGVPPYPETKRPAALPIGVATGLAYTPVGGTVLFIETACFEGSGKLSLTGQVGDVMKESVQASLTLLRMRASQLKISKDLFTKHDIHIHFPEGAVKKDGPSAGTATLVALASQFLGKSVASNIAFSGEISLRGDILPVGGLREKLVAAHRHGVKTIFLPKDNQKDTADLPREVQDDLTLIFVATVDELLEKIF